MRAVVCLIGLVTACGLVRDAAGAETTPQWTQYRTEWPSQLPCRGFDRVAASSGAPVYAEWHGADGRATLRIEQNGSPIGNALDPTRLTELRVLGASPDRALELRLSCREPANPELPTLHILWRCEPHHRCSTIVEYAIPPLAESPLRPFYDVEQSIFHGSDDERQRQETVKTLARALLDAARRTIRAVCVHRRCSQAAEPVAARLASVRDEIAGTIVSSQFKCSPENLRATAQTKTCAVELACSKLRATPHQECELKIAGCAPEITLKVGFEELEICSGSNERLACWGQSADEQSAAWMTGAALRAPGSR